MSDSSRVVRACKRRAGARRRLRAFATLTTTLVALLAALTGCGGSGSSGTSAGGGTGKPVLHIGLSTNLSTLDPSKSNGLPILETLAYAPIVHGNPDGSFSPALATKWGYVGSGNKVFQFTLRHDARFADGTPVTASAVQGWLKYFISAGGPLASTVGKVADIKTIGKWTVEIHFAEPNGIAPFVLADNFSWWGLIASPRGTANPNLLGTRTLGAGPYTVVPSESVSGDHYTLVPNRYFYDQSKIKYSKVVVKVIPSASTMLEALKTGQLDFAQGTATTADAARAAGFDVVTAPASYAAFLITDNGGALVKPLADVRVRQALNYAIDRKAITTGLIGKYGTPSSMLPMTDGFDKSYQDYYPYDPAKAKQLLAAAGYPNGFTVNVTAGTFDDGVKLAQAVAKYFSAVGVKLDISAAATRDEANQQAFGSRKFALWLCPTCGAQPTTQFYSTFLAPAALVNQHGWSDPELGKLARDGDAATDAAPYWMKFMQRTVTQAYSVPIAVTDVIYYVSKHVGGVEVSAKAKAAIPSQWFPK